MDGHTLVCPRTTRFKIIFIVIIVDVCLNTWRMTQFIISGFVESIYLSKLEVMSVVFILIIEINCLLFRVRV